MNISQAALRSATGHPDPLPVTASRRKADQITPTPHREKTVLFDGHAGTNNLAPSPPRGYQGPPKATKPSETNNDPPFTPKQVLTGVYNNIRSNVATAVEAYTILTPLRPRRTTEDSEKQAPWTTDVLAPATESTASVSDTSSLTTLSAPPATSPSKPSPGRLLAPNGRLPNRYSMPALPAPADNNFNPPTLNTATLRLTHNEDDAEGRLPDEETLRPNNYDVGGSQLFNNHDEENLNNKLPALPDDDFLRLRAASLENSKLNDSYEEDLNTKPPALPEAEFRRLQLLSHAATNHSPGNGPTLSDTPPVKTSTPIQKQSSLEASFAKAVSRSLQQRLTCTRATPGKPTTTTRTATPLPGALRAPTVFPTPAATMTVIDNSNTSGTAPSGTSTTYDTSSDINLLNPTDEAEFPSLHTTNMRPINATRRASNRKSTTFSTTTTVSPPTTTDPPTARKPSSKSRRTPAASPPPEIAHTHRAIVVLTVRVDAEDSFGNFLDAITDALQFMRKYVDPTTAFLPKKDSPKEFGPITSRETCPEVQFVLLRHYLDSKNMYAFANGKPKSMKTIKVSATLGINEDPKPLFDAVRGDLMNFQVSMVYKPYQALDTTNRLLFLGAPQDANKHETEETIYRILSQLEKKLRVNDPDGFPFEIHGGELPRFAIVSEQPGGLPYVEKTDAEKSARVGPPREQRTLQILCATADYDRLARLVMAAKEEKHWTKEFGPSCHPAEVPTNEYSESQRQRYVQMIETHRSSQLSAGSVPISGLRDADKEFTLRRLPDAKNRAQPPMELTIKTVMRDMKFKGKMLWLCVLKADNGRYTGYFSSGDAVLTAYVQAFLLCPAAQIYFYLLKRGYYKSDVERLIRNTFNFEQQSLIAETKYNADTRLAYIKSEKDEFMDIIQASYSATSAIDSTAGLSEAQLKLRQAQKDAVVGKLKVGDINHYDFDDGQSITSVHTKAHDDGDDISLASKSIGNTCFEPDDSDIDDDDLSFEDAATDELTTNKSSSVQFIDLSQLSCEPMSSPNNADTEMDVSESLGRERVINIEEDQASFATAMWKHCSGYAPDMMLILNILLTELEIPDYNISNSSVPTHLRELLTQETQQDAEVTSAYLLSIRESVEAGVAEQEALAVARQQEEDAHYGYTAGSPVTTTAEAVTIEQPRGCTESVGTSQPGVEES